MKFIKFESDYWLNSEEIKSIYIYKDIDQKNQEPYQVRIRTKDGDILYFHQAKELLTAQNVVENLFQYIDECDME